MLPCVGVAVLCSARSSPWSLSSTPTMASISSLKGTRVLGSPSWGQGRPFAEICASSGNSCDPNTCLFAHSINPKNKHSHTSRQDLCVGVCLHTPCAPTIMTRIGKQKRAKTVVPWAGNEQTIRTVYKNTRGEGECAGPVAAYQHRGAMGPRFRGEVTFDVLKDTIRRSAGATRGGKLPLLLLPWGGPRSWPPTSCFSVDKDSVHSARSWVPPVSTGSSFA